MDSMESIESVILTPSITSYPSKGPLSFDRNAESQRAFVLKTDRIVIRLGTLCGPEYQLHCMRRRSLFISCDNKELIKIFTTIARSGLD